MICEPSGPQRRIDAGVNRNAIDQHGADTALGLIAADLGPGELQFVAQEFRKRAVFFDVTRECLRPLTVMFKVAITRSPTNVTILHTA